MIGTHRTSVGRAQMAARVSAQSDRRVRARLLWPALAAGAVMLSAPALAEDCNGAAVERSLQSPGRAAAGVVTLGNRIVLIDDAGTAKQLLVCEIEGKGFVVKDRIELPADVVITKIEAEGSKLTLQTADGQRIEKTIGTAGTQPAEAVPPEGFRFSLSKKSEQSFALKVAPSATPGRSAPGPAIEIELKPIVPGAQIFTRKILHVDPSRNAVTAFWDEVGEYGTRAFIATFVGGSMTAGAQVPLSPSEAIPENFTGVLADGRPYYLETRQGKTVPVILDLDSAFADKVKPSGPLLEQLKREGGPDRSEKRGERIKKGVKKLAERALPSRAAGRDDDEATFQAMVRAAIEADAGPAPRAAAAPPPSVTRGEVAKCAEEFRDLQWTLTPGSYERSSVPNECDPPGRYWRRPTYLNGKSGQQVKGVPYCWGCSHSIAQFQDYVKTEKRLAGHSCTCRTGNYCTRPDVTGVDCSGFVSQCWKAIYHTTSSMSEIATIIDKSKIKQGDAFNLAGSHIRLFMGLVETDTGPRYKVIEAANSQGSIGRVIEQTYTASQLASYKAIRYNKVVE